MKEFAELKENLRLSPGWITTICGDENTGKTALGLYLKKLCGGILYDDFDKMNERPSLFVKYAKKKGRDKNRHVILTLKEIPPVVDVYSDNVLLTYIADGKYYVSTIRNRQRGGKAVYGPVSLEEVAE